MRRAVTENSFRKVRMRLEGMWTDGREVYGYFLTEEEFERLRSHVVQSGHLGGLGWETPHAFLADCGPRECSAPSSEHIRRIEQGGYIVGSTAHMEELLAKYGIEKRKIHPHDLRVELKE